MANSNSRQRSLRAKVEQQEKTIGVLNSAKAVSIKAEEQAAAEIKKLQFELGKAEKERLFAEKRCVNSANKLAASRDIVERSKLVWDKEKSKLLAAQAKLKSALQQGEGDKLSTIAELQEELDRCEATNAELDAELDNLRDALRDKDAIIWFLVEEIKHLEKLNVDAGHQITKLKAALQHANAQNQTLRKQLAGATAERLKRREYVKRCSETMDEIGVLPKGRGIKPIPARTPPAGARPQTVKNWRVSSVKHMAAVIKGRGLELVALAVKKNLGMQGLIDLSNTKPFLPVVKSHVAKTLSIIQERLDERCGLYLFMFLDLSRSKYEHLRNTQFSYDPVSDKYKEIVVWTNPFDDNDTLTAPSLPSRWPLEKERERVYGNCHVHESSDGHVERDFKMCAAATYSKYWPAMRKDIGEARPGQVLTFTDGTNGVRGSGLLHSECGVGDWLAGKACSRLSIDPGALGEFKESNEGIAASLKDKVAPSVNEMIKEGCLTIYPLDLEETGDAQLPKETVIPILCRHCGDFQFHKYASGQSGGTHPIWCCCVDFKLPDEDRCFDVCGRTLRSGTRRSAAAR